MQRLVPPRLALAGLVVALAGCQTDTPIPPLVVVTPAPVRGIIAQTAFSGFEAGQWFAIPIPLSQGGVLDITVDWAMASTWMYVYFGRTPCDYGQLAGHTCPYLISSETKDPKPRVIYTDTLEPDSYYVYLYNVPLDRRAGIGSENTEAVSLQVGLTIAASSSGSGEALRLGRPRLVPAPSSPAAPPPGS
jgi:hypothetical protein